MAETISGMPDAGPLTGDELFEVSQDSSGTLVSRKAALSVIAAYLGGVGPQNNFDGTADPTVADNAAEGYSVGSQWFNVSSGEIFKLIRFDGTDAVWVKTSLTLDELGSAASAAITDFLQVANNGSDIADPAAFRTALSLASAALAVLAKDGGTVPETDRTNIYTADQKLLNCDLVINNQRGIKIAGGRNNAFLITNEVSGESVLRALNYGGVSFFQFGAAKGALSSYAGEPFTHFGVPTVGGLLIAKDSLPGSFTAQAHLEVEGDFLPGRYTVATLPSSPAEGAQVYASDGLKSGETTGNGTGVPVYYSNGSWRVQGADTPVQA